MIRRLTATVLVAGLAALLAGCLLLPGRFQSDLSLKKDGTFAYRYTGEIYVLALSKFAGEMDKSKEEPFAAKCTKDDSFDERPCTAEETAEQKKTWDDEQKEKREKAAKERESMKAMLGGIDPSDPKAGELYAAKLLKQAGWKSVVSKGEGRFEVDFQIEGRLDHDFTFPVVEKMPMLMPFVQVIRRADGSVRVDAPAFSAGQSAMPLAALGGMAGGLMSAGESGGKGTTPPGFPTLDGHLTLHTDGTILANNTDEGPKAEAGGQRLDWTVNAQTTGGPPTALVKF